MNDTDSLGNELPDGKYLMPYPSPEEISEALALNTFLLVCKVAKQKGHLVIYDRSKRMAAITGKNGLTTIVTH